VVSHPQSEAAGLYREIALRLAARVANLPKDLSEKFGAISIKRV
jgi:hypothetical protein